MAPPEESQLEKQRQHEKLIAVGKEALAKEGGQQAAKGAQQPYQLIITEVEQTRLLNMQTRILKRHFDALRGEEPDRPGKNQNILDVVGEEERELTPAQTYVRERLEVNLRERERLLRQFKELAKEDR